MCSMQSLDPELNLDISGHHDIRQYGTAERAFTLAM